MSIHLSGDCERIVRSLMQGGRFASEDEVIGEALRLLREREEKEQSRVLEGIRRGIEDMNAGRNRPADEVFAEVRREFKLPPDA
jgi:antitoxin ParD1/3/4